MMDNGFMETSVLGDQFMADGYVILPAENRAALDRIRQFVAEGAADILGLGQPDDPGAFLGGIEDHVGSETLNDLRLAVIKGLNEAPWMRPTYYSLARAALESLAGNELAMQRRINLSVQLPNDDSSLLPVHADVWSGDSPYEVVLWVPLVDCHATKSMYLMPPARDREVQRDLGEFRNQSSEDLFQAIADDVEFLEVPYGHVLVFSQTLMHGNRVNVEDGTRWSMNCRFKSVFSPYADKKLGEFFEPITLRPATRFAMSYPLPKGFQDD